MKRFFLGFSLFLCFILMTSCNESAKQKPESKVMESTAELTEKQQRNDRIKVAFLIYPEIAILDMTGPMDAFIKANRMTENQYEVYTVSANTDMIQTQGHIMVTRADYTLENAPKPDILIVAGAKVDVVENLANDSRYANYIIETAEKANHIMSVCTGSFTLAKLGLLNNKKATTHWYLADKFVKNFPKTQLVRDVRYITDGKLTTTSGVTAGIDGAIALISEYSGDDFGAMVSRGLQHAVKEKDVWPEIPTGPMNHGDSDPIN